MSYGFAVREPVDTPLGPGVVVKVGTGEWDVQVFGENYSGLAGFYAEDLKSRGRDYGPEDGEMIAFARTLR